MSTEQSIHPADISNTKVFEYQQEVIVEIHGRTTAEEFEVVSYTFTADPDEEAELRHPEIPPVHEEVVQEALAETDYTLD